VELFEARAIRKRDGQYLELLYRDGQYSTWSYLKLELLEREMGSTWSYYTEMDSTVLGAI
jgi:hypothetical protein